MTTWIGGIRGWTVLMLLSVAAHAQTRHAPLSTVPERFADAPAVVIEHETEWDVWVQKSSRTIRKRVLIQSESGSDHADQYFYYDSLESTVRNFTARTVQTDGTKVDLPPELKHDLIAFRSGTREIHVLLFTFPGVKPGSILEWGYQIDSKNSYPLDWWEVQEEIPVLQAGYTIRFHKFPSVRLSVGPAARTPYDEWCEKVSVKSEIDQAPRRWECRELPAFEPEPFSPPPYESKIRLLMSWRPEQATSYSSTMWDMLGKKVRDEVRRLSKDLGSGPAVVARLRGEVAAEADLADRIHVWAKTNLKVRTSTSDDDLKKDRGEATSVSEILQRGGGTSNEVAIATLALLRNAKIAAKPVIVGDRTRERIDWSLPDRPVDPHLLLEVRTDGKPTFFDPGCDLCGPGIPDWRYCSGEKSGVRVDPDGVSVADVPPVRALTNSEHYREQVRLEPDGVASIAGEVRWFGQLDLAVRRHWFDMTDSGRQEYLRSDIVGDIDTFEAQCSDPDDTGTALFATYGYRRNDMALTVDGRLLITPPDPFMSSLALPVQEERVLPVWWLFPYSVTQEAMFTLPAGFEVERVPPEIRLQGPGLRFNGKWAPAETPGSFRWEGLLVYERTQLEASEYPDARRFAADLANALRRGIVASRPAASPVEDEP